MTRLPTASDTEGVDQVGYLDTHEQGYLHLREFSASKYEFGERFKKAFANAGGSWEDLETKHYRAQMDEREFDPPALPRPDTEAWKYIYGNDLVLKKVQSETLTPETEYKRGMFMHQVDDLKMKMVAHYGDLDWESKAEAMKQEWKNGTFDTFQCLKAEVGGEMAAKNPDDYVALYIRNNLYDFGPNDPHHHYVPEKDCDKWVAFQKFQWDKTSKKADHQPYIDALKKLSEAFEGPMKQTGFTGALTAMLGSHDIAHVKALVGAFQTASPTIFEFDKDPTDEAKCTAILEACGAKGKVAKEVADHASGLLRGAGVSGADISGKTVAEAAEILKGSSPDDMLELRFNAHLAAKCAASSSPAQLAVALAWGNAPDLFAQLFIPSDGVDQLARSGGAVGDFITAVGKVNEQSKKFGAALDKCCSACDAALKTHGVASSGLGAFLKSAGLAQAADSACACPEPCIVTCKAQSMAADMKAQNSWMGQVYLEATARYLATDEFQNSTLCRVINDSVYADASGFKGSWLQRAAQGAAGGDFGDHVAKAAEAHLLSAGKCSVVSSDMQKAIGDAFKDVEAEAEALNTARHAARDALKAVNLDVALHDHCTMTLENAI